MKEILIKLGLLSEDCTAWLVSPDFSNDYTISWILGDLNIKSMVHIKHQMKTMYVDYPVMITTHDGYTDCFMAVNAFERLTSFNVRYYTDTDGTIYPYKIQLS